MPVEGVGATQAALPVSTAEQDKISQGLPIIPDTLEMQDNCCETLIDYIWRFFAWILSFFSAEKKSIQAEEKPKGIGEQYLAEQTQYLQHAHQVKARWENYYKYWHPHDEGVRFAREVFALKMFPSALLDLLQEPHHIRKFEKLQAFVRTRYNPVPPNVAHEACVIYLCMQRPDREIIQLLQNEWIEADRQVRIAKQMRGEPQKESYGPSISD